MQKVVVHSVLRLMVAAGMILATTPPSQAKPAKERIVIYDFWASWCDACIKNLKTLGPLLNDFSRSRNRSIEAKVVSVDEDQKDFELARQLPVLRKRSVLNRSVVWDHDGTLQRTFNISSVPVLVVANSKGRILYRHEGLLSSADTEHLRRLVETKAKAAADLPSKVSAVKERPNPQGSRSGVSAKGVLLDATMDPGKTSTASASFLMIPSAKSELPVLSGGDNGSDSSCPTCGS